MSSTLPARFTLRFPQREREEIAQDAEFFEVELEGEWRRIRFHDYDEIYAIPGLYEQLFYEELKCQSPGVVVGALEDALRHRGPEPGSLRVLDVGAGNGMVAERLHQVDLVDTVVGVDIIEEAAAAAERDRPEVYEDYMVADLTALTDEQDAELAEADFNCMVTVAALGFGDIPCDAFAVALHHVRTGGLVAMTIKEEFLDEGDEFGFAGFIRRVTREGALTEVSRTRYRHRLSVTGEELYYVAVVAEKCGDIELRV